MPSGGSAHERRNSGLDLVRTAAILLVLAGHGFQVARGAPADSCAYLLNGAIGVDLFFVLSGLLIGGQAFRDDPLLGRREQLTRFWTRRWFRTLPLYFLVLFFYAALKPLLGFPFSGWSWRFLFFGQNYLPLSDFVQSWSLCIEEQFYLVLPIVAITLNARRLPGFFWLLPLLFSFGARMAALDASRGAAPSPLDFVIGFPTHTHLDGLGVGLFLASTARTWRAWDRRLRAVAGLAGAALAGLSGAALAAPASGVAGVAAVYSLVSIGFGGVCVWAEGVNLPGWLAPSVERLAIWSYGAYLWNNLLVRAFAHAFSTWSGWLAAPAFLFATFALAWLTYRTVERPFLALRDRILAR
jgi:peptidoglycan/LPS O-acetylase OafA/YrhL